MNMFLSSEKTGENDHLFYFIQEITINLTQCREIKVMYNYNVALMCGYDEFREIGRQF
jgi:hypothetical protein